MKKRSFRPVENFTAGLPTDPGKDSLVTGQVAVIKGLSRFCTKACAEWIKAAPGFGEHRFSYGFSTGFSAQAVESPRKAFAEGTFRCSAAEPTARGRADLATGTGIVEFQLGMGRASRIG